MNEMVEAEVIQVIRVLHRRGTGDSEKDPVRYVTEYFTLKGDKLAENDPVLVGA